MSRYRKPAKPMPGRTLRPPPPPSNRCGNGGKTTLGELCGVSPDDHGVDDLLERRTLRDMPRLQLSPKHSAIVILILTLALSLSLTLLVQQTIGMNRAIGESSGVIGESSGTGDWSATSSAPSAAAPTSSSSASATPSSSASDSTQSASPAQSPSGSTSPSASSPSSVGGASLIDLNTATAEQLESIKGVGPVTAQRILDHRSSIGRYSSVDDLLDVTGIGGKTLEKIRPHVTVGAPSEGGGP
ncbi:ComEA family DNA-binding protein [Bifidobacterium margollesii]|nr:helix-hairpin-helix domain-containing protein [Bifidobacterium margollesii]